MEDKLSALEMELNDCALPLVVSCSSRKFHRRFTAHCSLLVGGHSVRDLDRGRVCWG